MDDNELDLLNYFIQARYVQSLGAKCFGSVSDRRQHSSRSKACLFIPITVSYIVYSVRVMCIRRRLQQRSACNEHRCQTFHRLTAANCMTSACGHASPIQSRVPTVRVPWPSIAEEFLAERRRASADSYLRCHRHVHIGLMLGGQTTADADGPIGLYSMCVINKSMQPGKSANVWWPLSEGVMWTALATARSRTNNLSANWKSCFCLRFLPREQLC